MTPNEQIVQNLEHLIVAVEAQPQQLFDLKAFRQKGECGTLFCAAGLACTLPKFQAMGFELQTERDRYGSLFHRALINGLDLWAGASDPVFGEHSFARLFEVRNGGTWDEDHPSATYEGFVGHDTNDKALALWRLNKQLEIYKGKTQ